MLPSPAPSASAPTDEPLLATKDAAARLGLAADTLKRIARRGEIASIKLGKVRRFEPSVIRAYIAEHRVQRAG
jgi:excisionase family DNA binding protein